jgi:GAF domain-containing protein/biotin carboxyl carrier protein
MATRSNQPDNADSRSSDDILASVLARALALQEVALALAGGGEIETMAAAFLPVVANAVRSGEALLFEGDREGNYRLAAVHGVAEELRVDLEGSVVEQAAAGVAAAADQPVTRDEILADDSFQEWCGDQEIEEKARRIYAELYVPLRADGAVVGVLAVGRRSDGVDFEGDDLLFLEHVGSSAAVALSRCQLQHEHETKIEMLRALARFTSEITSTLDLNRVLQTVANTTEAVIERDRAVVALVDAGSLKVRAVSDKTAVEANEAEVLGIANVLAVLKRRGTRMRVTAEGVAEKGSEIPDREVFARYFEGGEMQSLLALPLQDEEGLLGYLVLESRNPDGFADANAEEFLGILSGSVAVAIRNADLYRRVPMVGFLAPIASRRRRLAAMDPKRRMLLMAGVGAVLLFVVGVPLPRYARGPATVRPSEILPVTSLSPGTVDRVYARGGKSVVAGAPVASLRNRESDARLAAAEADLAIAERRAAEASERRDPAEAQRWSLEAKNLAGWMSYARSEDQDQRLVAPVTGSILTPRIEERVGQHLDRGDVLCEIARLDPVHVEVQVSEDDIGGIRPGAGADVKVLAFPDRQFHGKILAIAPEGTSLPGKPATFIVTIECLNPELALLSGMTGRARLEAGAAPWIWGVLRPLVHSMRMKFWI